MTPTYQLLAIGNAIVDALAHVDDAFLATHQLTKGAMTLIDEAAAERLYKDMHVPRLCSGGSAANTAAGFALLGGRAAYIGKVRDDTLGDAFTGDLRRTGVAFETPAAAEGDSTARCLVFVTPDGERTMQTYLGICSSVSENDIDEALVAASDVIYIEGYLWDQPNAKQAIRKALTLAHDHDRTIAFTLSDVFCVERHRDEFRELVQNDIDLLFANEHELMALYETQDFETALSQLQLECTVAAITRSEKGSVVVTEDERFDAPPASVTQLVDTTGAGDLYASGFLYGLAQGFGWMECAGLGNRCAARIIQQVGARPEHGLHDLGALPTR